MNSCRSLSLLTVAVFLSTASTVVLWSSAALTIFDLAAPLAAGILDSHGFSREAAEGLGRRLQYVLTDEGEMVPEKQYNSFQSSGESSGDDGGLQDLLNFLQGVTIVSAIVAFAVPVLLMALVAWFYAERVTKKRDEWSREGNTHTQEDFRTSAWGCFDSLDYCSAGMWCFLPRVADTASAVGVWTFWQTIGIIIGIDFVGMLITVILQGQLGYFGSLISPVGKIVFFTVTRGKIRGALGLDPSFKPMDVFLWCCCPCCAAIQEAREIDGETQTKFQCCCAVTTKKEAELLVGDAVQRQGVP